MSGEPLFIALVMFLATYPSRVFGFVAPGLKRLSPIGLSYLRFVGPAVLSSLAAVGVLVTASERGTTFRVGIETVAVLACLVLVAWRRNLFLGLLVGVGVVVAGRTVGL